MCLVIAHAIFHIFETSFSDKSEPPRRVTLALQLITLASILTGRPAIVFNPAAVAESYVTALELMGKSHGTSNIYGYIMEWDYVTIGQACFNVYAPGNFRIVKNKTGGDPHAIETMVENLK